MEIAWRPQADGASGAHGAVAGQLGQRGDLIHRQHLVHFEEDDELAIHLAHALDEVGPDAGAEGGRRLDLGGRDLQHLRHRVDHHADVLALVVFGELDDDDAGAPGDLGALAAEAAGQVDHRHHRAAQVDHPADEGRHHRDLGDAAVLDDLLDVEDADGEHLAAEEEGEVLGRAGLHRYRGLGPGNSKAGRRSGLRGHAQLLSPLRTSRSRSR
jgi:hypothetical protein